MIWLRFSSRLDGVHDLAAGTTSRLSIRSGCMHGALTESAREAHRDATLGQVGGHAGGPLVGHRRDAGDAAEARAEGHGRSQASGGHVGDVESWGQPARYWE